MLLGLDPPGSHEPSELVAGSLALGFSSEESAWPGYQRRKQNEAESKRQIPRNSKRLESTCEATGSASVTCIALAAIPPKQSSSNCKPSPCQSEAAGIKLLLSLLKVRLASDVQNSTSLDVFLQSRVRHTSFRSLRG